MKRKELLRNVLAAVGAVFLGVIALSVLLALFTGGSFGKNKVAVVKIEGVILDPLDVSAQLRELGEREDVRAVVLRIDSPGGAVGPSQEIYSEVKRLKEIKPVVASMGSISASGGYYIAAAANKIVANPGTITGSIGVIIEFFNAQELLNKVGLKGYVVKSGRFKDIGSPLRGIEPEEKELIQGVIDDVHRQFVTAVAEGRGKNADDIRKIADGRIFTGQQAKELGLVDELGDLSAAIDISAKLAGIEEEPEVIYPLKRGIGFWKALTSEVLGRDLGELFTGLRLMYIVPNYND